jgi:diketogulonate reductase-like aldo/keto reductase
MLEALPSPKPPVNQIEVQPWYQQRPLVDYCQSRGIAIVAFCPLVRSDPRRMTDPVAVGIAKTHGKDVGQILLRWSLQHG